MDVDKDMLAEKKTAGQSTAQANVDENFVNDEEPIKISQNDIDGDFLTEDREYKDYTLGDWVLIALMGLLLAVVSVQVLGRLVFKSGGLAWSEELSRIVFVAMLYLGLGTVTKHDFHFKVDSFRNLPKWLSKAFAIIVRLVELVVMGVLVVGGVRLMIMTWATITPALSWPVSVFYAPLSIGGIGMMFHSFKKLIAVVRGAE